MNAQPPAGHTAVETPYPFSRIVSICPVGKRPVFDISVPGYENYSANAILNHNSGKTSIGLSAFTHLHATGKATRGLFAVPSIVQGQFHGEALTMLEPGKYDWHCNPGASREERIANYKDPTKAFNVVTHQALRDDILHLAGQHDGTSPDAVAAKLDTMKPEARRDYVRGVLDAAGINHDYLCVDEGHQLLNRAGKENSRMANVLDALGHGMKTHVSMTADPVKNDASEAFDVLAKMDPKRYADRDAFLRKYGVDTPAAADGLKREMARHFYTGSISSGMQSHKREIPVELGDGERGILKGIDTAAAAARLARMKGEADVGALRTLSPGSFEGVPEEQHAELAKRLNPSIGILANTAVHHAVSGRAKTDALAKLVLERKGKPGVVFCHSLERVREIEARLKADGHRVVTLTGADSSRDKDRKKREFQSGQHDVFLASDAACVGANLQAGKWLAQYDTPMTAMAQPLDAKILTPSGWRLMGEMQVGDAVICPDGTTAPVSGVYPQGIKDVFRVQFSDGSSTRCCMDHLWSAQSRDDVRTARGWRVRSLTHMAGTLLHREGVRTRAAYHIPLVGRLDFQSRDMPIEPYLLGAVLGDGEFGAKHVGLAGVDDHILRRAAEGAGQIGGVFSKVGNISYRLVGDKAPHGYPARMNSPVLEAARELGFVGGQGREKFIPVRYLFAAHADRLALLQGLMDADGTVDKRNGHASFCNTSRPLIDGVVHLAQSLGGVATVGAARQSYHLGKAGKMHWKVSLSLPVGTNPFSLPRKAEHVEARLDRRKMRRAMVSVEPVGAMPVQCIMVDHPDHLYVTDAFIVTHNTHAQRNGRIDRIGQTGEVELLDLVANHPAEARARKRLAHKYELRSILTSPLEGLDDTGLAGYLNRARAGKLEADAPLHAPTPEDHAPIVEDEQGSMF